MADKGITWWEEILSTTVVAIAFAVGVAWATVKFGFKRNQNDIERTQSDVDEIREQLAIHEKKDNQMHEDMMKMIRENAHNHEQLMAAVDKLHDTLKDISDERKFKERMEQSADAYTRAMLKVFRQHNLTLVRANDVRGHDED